MGSEMCIRDRIGSFGVFSFASERNDVYVQTGFACSFDELDELEKSKTGIIKFPFLFIIVSSSPTSYKTTFSSNLQYTDHKFVSFSQ